jgi:cation/acetate symporter
LTAGNAGADILFLVAWAFSIAAAGLFAALVMGVWYKKTTNTAAVVGMTVGYVVTFGYMIHSEWFGLDFIQLFGSKDAIIAAARQVGNINQNFTSPELRALAWLGNIWGSPMTTDTVVLRNRVTGRMWGIGSISAGIFGVPISFLVIYVVSQFTTAPSQAMQDFIDDIRIPKGGVRLADKSEAVE